MLKRYRNLGGSHFMKDQNGNKVTVHTGQVFVADDVIINRLQQPGGPVKFQLLGEVVEEEQEPVAVGVEATPLPASPASPVPTTSIQTDAQQQQRQELEAMTFEELKAYAANNMIDVSAARSKKAAIDLIMQSLSE